MGWFGNQIEQRTQRDNEMFEDSLLDLAESILGESETAAISGRHPYAQNAVQTLLKHYGIKEKEIPSNITKFEDKIEYLFSPSGIMYRNAELKEGWYKEAYGPMLSYKRDTNEPVALIPKDGKYFFFDTTTGKEIRVNHKTQHLISHKAMVFYEPLPLKKINTSEFIKYILKRLDSHDIITMVLATLAVVLVGTLLPVLYNKLFSVVVRSHSVRMLTSMAVFIFSVIISKHLFEITERIVTVGIGTKINFSVEAAAMMRIFSLPADFFKSYSAGELSSRMSQMQTFCTNLVNYVFSMGLTGLLSVVYAGQVFVYAPELLPTAATVTVLTLVLFIATAMLQMRISKKRMEYAAKENGIVYSLITGIQKIKLAGAEKRAFSKWAQAYAKEARLTYDPPLFLKLNTALNTAIGFFGMTIMYYIAIKSKLSVENYYSFETSYAMLQGAFMALSGAVVFIADTRPTLDMFKPLLETEPESNGGRQILTNISGGIELNKVSFKYNKDMPKVIDDLSLKIEPGQYIALVGKTGCGKSTLMRILLGFEKPQTGAVYYDGIDLNRLDLKALRRKIGVVMQDGMLFQGDIFSNISVSNPSLTLKEAWEIAEIAGIAEDIKQMPMGMHTLISEGQGGISGGQKQRLMIARAIASKPKILMLDEATSALDNITQKQISNALDKLKCTRIVIAHRLSTIINCDRIIVIDKGKIAEDGTYEELLAKNGFFADLVKRQQVNDIRIPQKY